MAAFFRARLWEPYARFVERKPLFAKMVTASVLMAVGDVVAQGIEHRQKKKKQEEAKDNAIQRYQFQYDYTRTLRMACVGFILTGPLLHQWYKILDKIVVGNTRTAVIKKIAWDQMALTPVALTGFLSILNLLERKSFSDLQKKMQRDFLPILLVNWTVWPAAQYVNFALVPANQRVLYVTVLGIFWNSYLCYMGNKK